eukprot:TRINITY_DN10990_c0_g1_i2.p1 TRINITY_DN10990_c0_g1~~TRINITY_DN10990_c0_g1_i2.p1  ORF type:complete len:332 (+),score=87.89 TRINITY_DN10990_c0_g1_i2:40-1035(+)
MADVKEYLQEEEEELKKKNQYFQLTKNINITGTFSEKAFQLSLINNQDPIPIDMIDMLGFHKIPHVGVYGESYEPSLPFVIIELPLYEEKIQHMSPRLISEIKQFKNMNPDEINTSFLIIFHSFPSWQLEEQHANLLEMQQYSSSFSPSSNNNSNISDDESNFHMINLMLHAWAFKNIFCSNEEIEKNLYTGIYDPSRGMKEHKIIKKFQEEDSCEEDSSINLMLPATFNTLSQRNVVIHGQQLHFSPNNLQILFDPQEYIHHFYSLTQIPQEHRQVLVFHVIPGNSDSEHQLQTIIGDCITLNDLRNNLSNDESFLELSDRLNAIFTSLV